MSVEDNDSNEALCKKFCEECPSYPKSGELLFCARRKSAQNIRREGCLCPGCDVFERYELAAMYYCESGPPE